jgi:hypothetical protein
VARHDTPSVRLTLAAALVLGCRAGSSGTERALLGTYHVELPASDSAGREATSTERWVLTLGESGRFTVTRAGQASVEGRYRVAADTLVFSGETGPRACPDGETGPGTYRWRLGEGDLTLTSVADRCDGRRAAFTARPLTRADAGTP